MKFLEAAQEILRQNGNQPMTSKEIWKEIEKQKLVDTKGKTPCATLNATILYFCKDSPIDEKYLKYHKYPPIFEIVDNKPMKFILLNYFLFNKIEDDINDEIQSKILLHSLTYVEKFGWNKRLSLYNINGSLEFHIEDVDKISYMIFDPAQDTIKIGKASSTNSPFDRLNQMKTGNPRLELICYFPFEKYTENDLHEKYDDFRKDREWFFYSKKIKEFVASEKDINSKIINYYERSLELKEIENDLLNLI